MNMMTFDTSPKVTIGELTRRLGLTARALRFYDEQGLVAAERDVKNRRVYSLAAAKELELLERLREAGLGLAEIRRALVSGRVQGPEALRAMVQQSLQLRQASLHREAQVVADTTAWLEGWPHSRRALPESGRAPPRKGTGSALRPSHVR